MITLKLNRLCIFSGTKRVYDENFHDGLNIIRGENSSGKSTILDFIFYSLGGYIPVWKTEAANCTSVYAEYTINSTIVTLMREVATNSRPPMSIFFGSLEKSFKDKVQGWIQHPYNSSGKSEGFSKIIFRFLGIPDAKSDNNDRITMHQLLRILYVDQLSKSTGIMREEEWDDPTLRESIAEILYGVFDDSLYGNKILLKDNEKDLKSIKEQITSSLDIIEDARSGLKPDKVQKHFESAQSRLTEVNNSIQLILENDSQKIRESSEKDLAKAQQSIIETRQSIENTVDLINRIEADIYDSNSFIQSLEKKRKSIRESLITRDCIGELPKCPMCDESLELLGNNAKCNVSGRYVKGDFGRSKMLKLQDELQFQITESKRIQERRKVEHHRLLSNSSNLSQQYKRLNKSFQIELNSIKTARNSKIDQLYQEKGGLETQIKNLSEWKKYFDSIANLQSKKEELEEAVAKLKLDITAKEKKRYKNTNEVNTKISEFTRNIIESDTERQIEFYGEDYPRNLILDYRKNTYLLDGVQNFSASSNVMMKNAIHFSMLLSALEIGYMRHPKFMLCDNIDEGGMEDGRCKNFQMTIFNLLNKYERSDFQAIISTSKIHEELNTENNCVGKNYTHEKRSLDFS